MPFFKTFTPLKTAIAVLASAVPVFAAQADTPVFINEIHYDNVGTDVGEAIEIAGPAGTNLTGWRIVRYNGNNPNNGVVYTSPAANETLTGTIPDSGNGFGYVVINYPVNGLQNGPNDGFALVDGNDTVIQFLSYEGVILAGNGPAAGMTSIDIGVAQENPVPPIGYSLQLSGSGTVYEDFVWNDAAQETFGTVNNGQIFGTVEPPPPPISQCGRPATLISSIQGSGDASPLTGTVQHVEAVVTGSFQGAGGLNGFFVQEEDHDADDDIRTSEGLFVASIVPVNTGDTVHLVGTVSEQFNMTRLVNLTSVDVCATDSLLPALTELTLPFAPETNDPEWREGMLVNLPQTLTVTENFNLGRFGEAVVSSGGRLMIPTQVAEPGEAANSYAEQNALNRLIIDDGSNRQNPDPLIYPGPDGLSAENTLRSGDTVTDAMGVLAYDFGAFRLQPIELPVFEKSNPRSETPPEMSGFGSLKVASFNVLNYFNGDGFGGGFPTSRGASSMLEFNRQTDKIVAAITGLDSDIIGLMELENDGFGPESAISDLVDALNQKAGVGAYAYIDPGVNHIGNDAIANGIIYKPAKTTPVNAAAILDSSIDPRFNDGKSRPVLAQSFLDKASNKIVTVSVNHLKSKGSDCNDIGDPDIGDGQGNCNLTRTEAAEALADWVKTDPTGSDSANQLIIGDLNAYAKEDPIATLNSAGFTDLLAHFIGRGKAYSYVFRGESGYLDHALANSALLEQVKDTQIWHINADEPRALDYNVEFKSADQIERFYNPDVFRSSDHDPIVLEIFVPGDLDNNGSVDHRDFVAFRRAMGQCEGRPRFNREADYDNDGCVTQEDYRLWYKHFRSYLRKSNLLQ
ncbi:MAG: hypothetical protein CVV06_13550 [Gammaproteobacteria bacterium HGW-Gammaproteobacteria-10]|nr:MAG: hypothetical protein CVV06_13550 [Gammaproteobacteria bacterium HGW-Gammaproteobacteria-10]